jgi:hypothetical protein
MRSCRWTTLVALLTACGQEGPPGRQGLPGPPGEPGPAGSGSTASGTGPTAGDGGAGSTRLGVIWKDRTGAVVPVIVGVFATADLHVLDRTGYVWRVDAWTGEPVVPPRLNTLYDGAGCTGNAFAPLTFPRTVFGLQSDAIWHSVRDDPQVERVAVKSMGSPSACTPYVVDDRAAVPVAETVPVAAIVVPSKLFEPPLHPEYRL